MDTKLLKLCDLILCSSLTGSRLVLSTSADLYFPDRYLPVYQMLARTIEPHGSLFLCCRDLNDVR